MNTSEINIQIMKRFLVVGLLISGIITYFIACQQSNYNDGLRGGYLGTGGDPNYDLAMQSDQISNHGGMSEFLSHTTRCCDSSGGIFSCGAKNLANNILGNVLGANCFSGGNPINLANSLLSCGLNFDNYQRRTKCSSYNNSTVKVRLFFNDHYNSAAGVRMDFYFNGREQTKVAFILEFHGSILTGQGGDGFRFTSNRGFYIPVYHANDFGESYLNGCGLNCPLYEDSLGYVYYNEAGEPIAEPIGSGIEIKGRGRLLGAPLEQRYHFEVREMGNVQNPSILSGSMFYTKSRHYQARRSSERYRRNRD